MGILVDWEKNKAANGKEVDISAPGATIRTLVIPTNEELAIAKECMKLLNLK